jgi:aryl-alcohol dehydrogenase-like predicted oxidoreductase
LFDTADVYGFGHSEEILSKALGEQRKDVVIATKFGVKWNEQGRIKRDISPDSVIESLEGSLRRLRIESIPLYQIHWPDGTTPISSTMEALVQCQEAGKIRFIGCCNFAAELVREAQKIGTLVSLQAPYNIIDRTIMDADLAYYAEECIAVLAYSPLAQGLLTGKYGSDVQFTPDDIRSRSPYFQEEKRKTHLEVVQLLTEIGRRYEKTPAQVAVRWILDSPGITCALTGTKTVRQVEENAGAHWALSGEDWEVIDRFLSPKGAEDPRR